MEATAGPADPPDTALFFQGSISEAIARAQARDLLLLVFVAGDNPASASLELTTFQDPTVLDEVKKDSLMLRLQEGSTDANNFSAIFPVKHVPSITFIGYKGSLLHQLEGYQEPEVFLTALRHAATAFKTEVQRAVASAMAVFLSTANNMQASGAVSSAPEPQFAGNSPVDDMPVQPSSSPVTHPAASSQPVGILPNEAEESLRDVNLPGQVEPTEVTRNLVRPEAPLIPDSRPTTVENRDGMGGNSSAPKPVDLSSSLQDSKMGQNQVGTDSKQGNGKKAPLRREPSGPKPVRVRTGPFLLQVRLTNGETIQGTFESFQLLREVKNFVDFQRTDGNMEFQLAIPFPRKVFTEGDMDKTLSKLDIGPRSTLILVGQGNPTVNPSHSRASASNAADSSSQSEPDTTGGSYVGKFLSFLSPYIYGRPAASGDQTGYSSVPQDDANPASSRALRQGSQPPTGNSSQPDPPFVTPYSAGSNPENSASQAGRLNQRRGSGNIHTLRGDDAPKGNAYWNGNSTQFGANDEAKED